MSIAFSAPVSLLRGRRIVRLPAEASAQLPSRGMVMASISLPDGELILPLEPDGQGGHWFELPDDIPTVEALSLSLSPLDDWPEPELPQDIQSGLADAGLASVWQGLTTKARWEWLRWIRATASPATRSKRIGVACSKLSQGDRRPCCFNSASCTVPELSRSGLLLADDLP